MTRIVRSLAGKRGSPLAVLLSALAVGCALMTPLPAPNTVDQRLATIPVAAVPVDGPVTIYWNDQQIPFIEAESDRDAAVALGIVHAHLRLGQMELARRIAQGRVAEVAGPFATDIDYALRLLDFDRAVPDTEAMLSLDSRLWLQGFVAGINHYVANVEQLPHEFEILNLEREPWRVADVLAVSRLAAVDVNWLVWANLIPLRDRPDWPEIWRKLTKSHGASEEAAAADGLPLARLLAWVGRTGSNALALGPARTETGAPIVASDPHLGQFLPNIWLVAAVRTPTLHVGGLMLAGLPIFAIGRNPWIAWSGTNLRAASSELYDVSALDPYAFKTRREEIAVRWWIDRRFELRETGFGPVVTDAPQFAGWTGPPLALRWMGHRPSDEIGSFLAVTKASSFDEFRQALDGFALPGQNMIYADREGHIGKVMAVRLPRWGNTAPNDLILDPATRDRAWLDPINIADLPQEYDPDRGYVVSANDRPSEAPFEVGLFFSPSDRLERMAALIEKAGRLSVQEVERLQLDVYMASSIALRDLMLARVSEVLPTARATPAELDALALIGAWDGRYATESRGALAFELFKGAFLESLLAVKFGDQDWAAYASIDRTQQMIMADIELAAPTLIRAATEAGLKTAAQGLDAYGSWGKVHRLRPSHPFAMVPLIGGSYRFGDVPVAGSSETLTKSAHGPVTGPHAVRYGSNARHISDLSDLDENFVILLGGQDGWLNSATFLDQLDLWREGEMIRLPLRPETVRTTFHRRTILTP